jgi:hypothetical protein
MADPMLGRLLQGLVRDPEEVRAISYRRRDGVSIWMNWGKSG